LRGRKVALLRALGGCKIAVPGRATGCQRPLVVMQQAGSTLIQANADGEPETVLQWLKSVVDHPE